MSKKILYQTRLIWDHYFGWSQKGPDLVLHFHPPVGSSAIEMRREAENHVTSEANPWESSDLVLADKGFFLLQFCLKMKAGHRTSTGI